MADAPRESSDARPGPESGAHWVLRLYVTGMTRHSLDAIANLQSICDELLPGRHELSIVDIRQEPDLAREDRVVAAPMLVKRGPLPGRRLIGGLADRARVLKGLELTDRGEAMWTPAL